MTKNEKLKAFLKELSELSVKFGIEISGCGCCGSPFLAEIEDQGNIIAENLGFGSDWYTATIEDDGWKGEPPKE